MSEETLLEVFEPEDRWVRVPYCTCAAWSLGPGPCEPSCGWVEAEGA